MIFGVEITQITAGLNQLLKLGLLRDEIGLQKKNAPATAVSMAGGGNKTLGTGQKGLLWATDHAPK